MMLIKNKKKIYINIIYIIVLMSLLWILIKTHFLSKSESFFEHIIRPDKFFSLSFENFLIIIILVILSLFIIILKKNKQFQDAARTDIANFIKETNAHINNLTYWKNNQYSLELLNIEKKILFEAWEKLYKSKKDFINYAQNIKNTEEYQIIGIKIGRNLLALLKDHNFLYDRCLKITGPMNDYFSPLLKLNYIKNVVSNIKIIEKQPFENQFLWLRENIHFIFQISKEAQKYNIPFNTEKWINDIFVEFVDLFLKNYQKDCLRNSKSLLNEAHKLIIEILEKVDLEPIEIILEKTFFNDEIHKVHSKVMNTRLANNVIIGVRNNGFISKKGVIKVYPNVIINSID